MKTLCVKPCGLRDLSMEKALFLSVQLLFSSFQGCVTQSRPIKGLIEDPKAKKLILNLEGIDPHDLSRPDMIFELSACVEPTPGTVRTDDKKLVIVNSNLNPAQVCTLTVKIQRPDPTMVFINKENQGILYQSHHVIINQTVDGQLVGIALLQKMYHHEVDGQRRFTITIPLIFPQEETNFFNVSGVLEGCSPQNFSGASSFKPGGLLQGTLEIWGSILEAREFTCKTLWIDVNGVARKYYAAPPNNINFKALPGESALLPPMPLSLYALPLNHSDSLMIEMKEAPIQNRCDFRTEVFDTRTRTCMKK